MYDAAQWVDIGHSGWASVNLNANRFSIRVNSLASHHFDFDTACDYTAQKLLSDWPDKPLYLGLSGGLDSELVANVLLRNAIEFVPVIIDIDNVNNLEVWHAYHWCWRNNVTPVCYRMSTEDFENNFLPYLRKLHNTHQVGLIMIMWLADKIAALGGCLLTAVAELNLDSDSKTFYSDTLDYPLNLFDGNRHPSAFFSYTPELVLSYIRQFDLGLNEQYNKINFYKVPPRPKYNWTSRFQCVSPKSNKLLTAWQNKTPPSSRHNWGTQQDIINLLTGTK